MPTFHFTLIVDGPDLQDYSLIDSLFEAGCDDAAIGCSDGVQYVDFDREAEDFDDAILSAVDDLEKLDGVEVVRIADAGLTSLTDIAVRVGRTRESVRLLASGARGPGEFPKPVTDPRNRYRLWRWTEVAHWFMERNLGECPEVADDELTAAYNAALEFRHHRRLLAPSHPITLRELVDAGLTSLTDIAVRVGRTVTDPRNRYALPGSLQATFGTAPPTAGPFPRSPENTANTSDEFGPPTPRQDTPAKTDRTGRCALCGRPIQAGNRSREHVIPNAVGGRKTVSGFICKDCNHKTGATWDHALCIQLQPLCTLLNIRRHRGTNQPVPVETLKGDTFLVHPDGRMSIRQPACSVRDREGRKEMNIKVPSMRDLKRMLPGLARKYPTLDVKRLLSDAMPRREYLEDPLSIPLSFGGKHAGRSIVKSCLALATEAGVHLGDCEHARDYLLADGEPCFGYYNETDVVLNRPARVFFHCVFVQGDPASGKILGYVEYFGFQRMVLCLSSRYDGEPFSLCYAIDPISGENVDLQIRLALAPEDIAAAYSYEKLDTDKLKSALDALMEFYMEGAIHKAISAASADAVEYAFANCGALPGEPLTDEHRAKISRLLFERVEPFLIHLLTPLELPANDIRNVRAKSEH